MPSDVRPRVSLKDVAAAVGLATSTVSQALRNAGTVSPETCRRVQEVARTMGYRPDPVLASLAQRRFAPDPQRRRTIALLYSCHDLYGADTSHEDASWEHAHDLGYDVCVVRLADAASAPALGRQLYHRGVVGIILDQLFGLSELPDVEWNHFAVVSRGRQPHPVPFSCVRWEIFETICSMYRRLRARGYRRVGWALLCHEPEHPDDVERRAAALFCLSQMGPAERVPILQLPLHPKERVFAEVAEWAAHFRPDAVIGFNDLVYVGLIRAGLAPRNIGFSSLHIEPRLHSPHIAGVIGDNATLRQRAMDLLDMKIRTRARGAEQHLEYLVLPPVWSEGLSLRRGP